MHDSPSLMGESSETVSTSAVRISFRVSADIIGIKSLHLNEIVGNNPFQTEHQDTSTYAKLASGLTIDNINDICLILLGR
jgi:hypothetical protein